MSFHTSSVPFHFLAAVNKRTFITLCIEQRHSSNIAYCKKQLGKKSHVAMITFDLKTPHYMTRVLLAPQHRKPPPHWYD